MRLRLLRAIDAGASQSLVAEQFAVLVPTIKSSLKRRQESGHILPKVIPGRPNIKGATFQAHLLAPLETYSDVRREEHGRLFKDAHGIQVSPASITCARQALGWTRKKPSVQ